MDHHPEPDKWIPNPYGEGWMLSPEWALAPVYVRKGHTGMSDSHETIEIQRMHMAYDIANTHQGPAADLAAKFLEQTLAKWVGTETAAIAPNDWQKITDMLAPIQRFVDVGSDYTMSTEFDRENGIVSIVYLNRDGIRVLRRHATEAEAEQAISGMIGGKDEMAVAFLFRKLTASGLSGLRGVKFDNYRQKLYVVSSHPDAAEKSLPSICCGFMVDMISPDNLARGGIRGEERSV